MKIESMDGEFAFKALIWSSIRLGWIVSDEYFLSREEVIDYLIKGTGRFDENIKFKWPVEIIDGKIVRIPDKGELE